MCIEKIVLNIPHSRTAGFAEYGWGNDVLPYVEEWTDWQTDTLFYSLDKRVRPIIFELSRFVVDVERLPNDPMEKDGQGIIYRRFGDAVRGDVDEDALMAMYHKHHDALKSELTETSLLIDCHSYPTKVCKDIDICIGYNEDGSKPSDDLLSLVVLHFEQFGYKVGINNPYSNSISPAMPFSYPSLMIEVNKAVYADADGMEHLHKAITSLYAKIFSSYGKENQN